MPGERTESQWTRSIAGEDHAFFVIGNMRHRVRTLTFLIMGFGPSLAGLTVTLSRFPTHPIRFS